jgi:hypothetical protein
MAAANPSNRRVLERQSRSKRHTAMGGVTRDEMKKGQGQRRWRAALPLPGFLGVLLATWALASPAKASPDLLVSSPTVDAKKHEISMLVGGLSKDRTPLHPTAVQVEIDGKPVPSAGATAVFSETARSAAAASKSWKPPLAVGLVYLWVKDIPAGIADAMLDGFSGFFRRIPARTNVYATLYGRKRQPIPRLTAAEISFQLHDIGYLGGDRPNLADAIRLDLKAVLGDESPFKIMLVVTDGRDHDDSTGDSSADFVAVADEVEKAGVRLVVVSFPPFEADLQQSTKNLFDLATAGAIRRAVEQPLGMQSTLEAVGQAIADMRWVRAEIPWGWRLLGGTRRLRAKVTIDDKPRVLEAGEVIVPSGATRWLAMFGILLGLVGLAGVVTLYWRRRAQAAGPGEGEDKLSIVAAAHALIRRGLSAPRVLVELTRSFPEQVSLLASLDASVLTDERFPLFQTRPGKRRFEELQGLLSHQASDDSLLGSELAEILAQSVAGGTSPDQVAASIVARVPENQWGAFSRMALDELAHALQVTKASHPLLASPHARGVALQIQMALRSESQNIGDAVAVGWLVRAAGPGRRGETIRLPAGRTLLGQAPECYFRMDGDMQVAAQHAAIAEHTGTFSVQSMQGAVSVEAKPVNGRTPLHDGDTIEIGQSRFVFKCVSNG